MDKYIYIPETLKLNEVLAKNPPHFRYSIQKFEYILNLLTEIPGFDKEILKGNGYIPINSTRLQSKIHDYKQYIDYLIKSGIIEGDNHYIPNEKSRGFRFTKDYQTLVNAQKTNNKYIRDWSDDFMSSKPYVRSYNYLCKWFNPSLAIDMKASFNYLYEELSENLKEDSDKAILKQNVGIYQCDKISKGQFYFIVDSNVKRVHTNLTGLKKELRKFITYDGQQLVSVDISNSQPYLSTILLDEQFYQPTDSGESKSKINIYNITDKTKYNSIYTTSITTEIHKYIMLVKDGTNPLNTGFTAYINGVKNGTFYKSYKELVESKSDIVFKDDRELKDSIFMTLYSNNSYIGLPGAEPKALFKSIYPEVYKVFSMLKKKDNTVLPRILQGIERHLIVNKVCKRISCEKPKLPIFTIHDSVVCPVNNEEYVAGIIKEEALKLLGLEPHLKYEYWK